MLIDVVPMGDLKHMIASCFMIKSILDDIQWQITYTIVDETEPSSYEKYAWKVEESENEMCLAVKIYEKNGIYPYSPTSN